MADINKTGNNQDTVAADNLKASGLVSSVPTPTGENSAKERIKKQNLNTKGGKGGSLLTNLIFFFVLALFIACIVFLIIWFGGNRQSGSHSATVNYTVLINVENMSLISNADGKCKIPDESSIYLNSDDGEINVGVVKDTMVRDNGDGTADVMVLISAEASHTEGKGYFVNNEKIAVGKEMNCRFEGFTDICTVISMNVSE